MAVRPPPSPFCRSPVMPRIPNANQRLFHGDFRFGLVDSRRSIFVPATIPPCEAAHRKPVSPRASNALYSLRREDGADYVLPALFWSGMLFLRQCGILREFVGARDQN